jgi:hypothetical protein
VVLVRRDDLGAGWSRTAANGPRQSWYSASVLATPGIHSLWVEHVYDEVWSGVLRRLNSRIGQRRGREADRLGDQLDGLLERGRRSDDVFAVDAEYVGGWVPGAHVVGGELVGLGSGGVAAQRLLERHVEVEHVALTPVDPHQVFDHLPVAGFGEDAFQDDVIAVVQGEPHGLTDQLRCQAAGLVELAQDDAAQVVLLDPTDQGWWRSRS